MANRAPAPGRYLGGLNAEFRNYGEIGNIDSGCQVLQHRVIECCMSQYMYTLARLSSFFSAIAKLYNALGSVAFGFERISASKRSVSRALKIDWWATQPTKC
jgi:hypothetical protein